MGQTQGGGEGHNCRVSQEGGPGTGHLETQGQALVGTVSAVKTAPLQADPTAHSRTNGSFLLGHRGDEQGQLRDMVRAEPDM